MKTSVVTKLGQRRPGSQASRISAPCACPTGQMSLSTKNITILLMLHIVPLFSRFVFPAEVLTHVSGVLFIVWAARPGEVSPSTLRAVSWETQLFLKT